MAALGCLLIMISIKQIVAFFEVADLRLIISSGIISTSIGVFIVVLMIKE